MIHVGLSLANFLRHSLKGKAILIVNRETLFDDGTYSLKVLRGLRNTSNPPCRLRTIKKILCPSFPLLILFFCIPLLVYS